MERYEPLEAYDLSDCLLNVCSFIERGDVIYVTLLVNNFFP